MSPRPVQRGDRGVGGLQRSRQRAQPPIEAATAVAVSLRDACARLGFSYGHGLRLAAVGAFPIPELPRRTRRAAHRYSSLDIDRFLPEAATQDVASVR